jgi:hypothetical protein
VALAGGAGWLVLHLVAGEVHPLGSAAISLGVLQAVRGAGTGIGPAIASALPRRYGNAIDHAAAVTAFVAIAIFPLAFGAPLFLAIALTWGMGVGANWVLSSAGVQQHASDGLIGRLASLDELATTASMVTGALIAAEVVTRAGSPIAAAWLGATMGAASWFWLGRWGVSSTAPSARIESTEPGRAVRPGARAHSTAPDRAAAVSAPRSS